MLRKFTYFSNYGFEGFEQFEELLFCRIQNSHIPQTIPESRCDISSFVEFKIYISLKHIQKHLSYLLSFVEFKIYISLKPSQSIGFKTNGFVEFKIYISLKQQAWLNRVVKVLQNSKFTYLSNELTPKFIFEKFCRIQNLHISQTT